MEQEICRRETTQKVTTIFKCLAYVFGAFAALCLITVIMVATIDDGWGYVFTDSSYGIPLIIALISVILAVVFFIIDQKQGVVTSLLVLTNKRIYSQISTSKIKQIKSYNLNAVTYHGFNQTTSKGKSVFTLTFKTSTDIVKFIVDEEFYNEFVNATINA